MYNQPVSRDILEKVAEKLSNNGIQAVIVGSGAEAKAKVLEMISKDAEVMTMTSVTLDTIGVPEALAERGQPLSRSIFSDPKASARHKREVGAAPDVSVASVHAVTEAGELVIVSNTGSQLPAAAYGAGTAIFVIGNQKIVPDLSTAMKRIHEHVLPLESERANKAYNITTGSFVSKVLVIHREVNPERIKAILVEEPLGF